MNANATLIAAALTAPMLAFAAGWLTAPGPTVPYTSGTRTAAPAVVDTAAVSPEEWLETLKFPADTPLHTVYLQLAAIADTTSTSTLRARFFALSDPSSLTPTLITHARSLILTRLATLNPNVALTLAREAPDHRYHPRASDFSTAFPGIAEQPQSRLFSTILNHREIPNHEALAYFKLLADGQLDAAATALRDSGRTALANQLTNYQIYHLAKTDIAQAFADIEKLPANRREGTTRSLYEKWAEVDAPAAWEGAIRDPAINTNGYYLAKILVNWMESDPGAAIARLDDQSIEKLSYSIREVSEAYAKQSPAAANAWVASQSITMGDRDSKHLYTGLAKGLATSDPQAAKNLITGDNDLSESTRKTLLGSFLAPYLDADRQEALAWIESLPPELRLTATQRAVGHLDHRDPTLAFRLLDDPSLPDDELFRVLKSSGGTLARVDFEQFLKTASRVPPEHLNETLANAIDNLTGEGQIDSALAIIETIGYDNEHIVDEAQELVSDWTKIDPAASSAWVESLPGGELRDYAYLNLIDAWIRLSPADATAWLDAQPPGISRDRAARAAAERLSSYDPAAALAWISSIEDDQIRNGAVSASATHFSIEDLDTLHEGGLISGGVHKRFTEFQTSQSSLLDYLKNSAP